MVKSIKSAVIKMLNDKGDGLTFVNLSEIPGFTGDASMEIENKNIHCWFHCSLDGINALKELLDEKRIEITSTSHLSYVIDGQIPRYPIARQNRFYNEPRWFPSQIVKGKKFSR
ncbi:MAG: hypothetical protein A4E69_01047 [Syntrophus sp. PtaB.Bin138]|nr:hypothetical protein [Geobacteraceae bacterium]OPY14664.1 MAG: hypothetical protein A4E69_01047 [Syntrophus sp. PtaB.Bin138]